MHVLIRADGGGAVGMGHVTRCLAIASGLRKLGVRSTFVTAAPAAVARKIKAQGCGVVRLPRRMNSGDDAQFLLRQARSGEVAAAVVDSYQLGSSYQSAIRAAGVRLCVIEDVPRGRIAADLVIDQRIGARTSDHVAAKSTRFLLGPRYSLLRPVFARVRSSRRRRRSIPRILIIMGGSDPTGATLRALAALDMLPQPFSIDVVAGVAYRYLARLATAVRTARHRARLHHDPKDIAAVMTAAELAVSAAGGTSLELACLGIPALLLVTAKNQKPNAHGLSRSGVALCLGRGSPFPARRLREGVSILLRDPRRRRRMSLAGSRLVDGVGARRVAAALVRLMRATP